MHEVLVNRLGGLSLPTKSVVRLTDRPNMTLDVYRGRKTTMQQQQQQDNYGNCLRCPNFRIFTVYAFLSKSSTMVEWSETLTLVQMLLL